MSFKISFQGTLDTNRRTRTAVQKLTGTNEKETTTRIYRNKFPRLTNFPG